MSSGGSDRRPFWALWPTWAKWVAFIALALLLVLLIPGVYDSGKDFGSTIADVFAG